MFFLSYIQPFSHFSKTPPMDRHRFIIQCKGLRKHTLITHSFEHHHTFGIGLIADYFCKAIPIPFINTHNCARHGMSTPLIQYHQLLTISRQSSSHQEQRRDIHLKAFSLLRISIRFCNQEVYTSLRYDQVNRIRPFTIVGCRRNIEMFPTKVSSKSFDTFKTHFRKQERFCRQVYPIDTQ